MKRIFLGMLICMLSSVAVHAQIGYQVSLLNSATGEPRANETVSANIVITDSQNNTVYSATQSVTTNDFGVLSFVVGDANTFKNVAIGKLPLFISVTVGSTLVGRSQILNVPVAEIANTLKSDFTLENLCNKTWTIFNSEYESLKIIFYTNGTWTATTTYSDGSYETDNGKYEIEGNTIYTYGYRRNWLIHVFRYSNSSLYSTHTY